MRLPIFVSLVISLTTALVDSALAKAPKTPKLWDHRTTQLASVPQITWSDNASNLRGQLNQDFVFICPPNGSIYKVWGTDVYTDDSSICNAAVHAGLITTRNGGQVTIRIRPGAGFYYGTTRNGVNSRNYGSWGGSFILLGSTRSPGSLQWNGTASNLRGQLNQDFVFICPPNGSIYKVWGTDIYTDDSSICNAAVHAGLITTRNGGQVTIRIRPGAGFYYGTTRNGVNSRNYGSWGGSFIFVR
ncbi:LCCL domain-containing protein [Nostoc sp. NOS(2021)]|uniref:LCCL domain-containing protein n=1 Tax=Nostoc sp. NOS(2021) TaxID=2815407 RepID=UPI0025E4E179|nr:LCCL domain-containing protein [Nostoc sp. NOS(2021)]